MIPSERILALCVALTPQRYRLIREEQWRADFRDGPEMGISAQSLLLGALTSSIAARFHDAIHRGSFLLSRLTRGKKMKLVIGMIGAAALVVGGAIVGVQALQPKAQHLLPEALTIQGYEGWWNSTPADGNIDGLPQETVTVNTRTGKVIDVFNRTTKSTSVDDVTYQVVPDPAWPANSIVIIDTASGKVIEDFIVDERGSAFDKNGEPYSEQQ